MTNLDRTGFIDVQFNEICINAYREGFPFALYRLPNSENTILIVSSNKNRINQKIDLEDSKNGFVASPFINNNGKDSIFIEADFIVELGTNSLQILKNNESLYNILTQPIAFNSFFDSPQFSKEIDDLERSEYLYKVEKAKNYIKSTSTEKIVLSRKKTFGAIKTESFYSVFFKLENAYKSAFISCIFLPWADQIWLGATPEILVTKNQESFQTVALAGTQASKNQLGEEIHINDALWSHKEIEEQALVSRYIINCFKKIRVREYLEEGPRTIKAGNLLHLNSKFTVNLKDINFPQFGTVMLDLLHPTSAVCGMPKSESLEFLLNNENYDRELYSGFIGPVNINNTSQLYVNLRTMKIQNSEFTLFAGGGITENSIPEKEWIETELKFNTILNIL